MTENTSPQSSYRLSFSVRWADVDPNQHLRHTAFNDYAAHVRFSFLNDHGFGAAELTKNQIGPVIFREETRFFKEVRLGEEITVSYHAKSMDKDGKKWTLLNHVYKSGDVLAATILVEGAWMDLKRRKLTTPPADLRILMESIPKEVD